MYGHHQSSMHGTSTAQCYTCTANYIKIKHHVATHYQLPSEFTKLHTILASKKTKLIAS